MKINIILLYLFCLLSIGALAQQVNWDGSQPFANITPGVNVLEDRNGELSFDKILSTPYQNAFKPSAKKVLNFGFTESVYWLRFSVNNTASETSVLEIAHAFLPVTDLYYKDFTGHTIVIKAGYRIPLNSKNIRQPLPARTPAS